MLSLSQVIVIIHMNLHVRGFCDIQGKLDRPDRLNILAIDVLMAIKAITYYRPYHRKF